MSLRKKAGIESDSIEIISELIREILLESLMEGSADNPVVKNISAKADFDEYVSRTENKGDPFTKEELDSFDTLDTKPYKKIANEVRFSSTEITSNKNKELAVVKKSGRYVAFFSARQPTDVSPDVSLKDIETDEKDDGDEIIIKVSRPFSDPSKGQDTSLLFSFVNLITKEYQI